MMWKLRCLLIRWLAGRRPIVLNMRFGGVRFVFAPPFGLPGMIRSNELFATGDDRGAYARPMNAAGVADVGRKR